jgi:transcriptional regulator with XRE-family HTH domain
LVPLKVARRILAGENHVRVWREHRGMKVGELATAANISHAYLSQIENGKRDGTVSTMQTIARVLKVDLDDLLPPLDE